MGISFKSCFDRWKDKFLYVIFPFLKSQAPLVKKGFDAAITQRTEIKKGVVNSTVKFLKEATVDTIKIFKTPLIFSILIIGIVLFIGIKFGIFKKLRLV